VRELGLEPGRYLTVVARPEPENSLLEIVQGFSSKPRGLDLAVLGNYSIDNAYHRAVKAAASNEVKFVGAIYDKPVVQALRFHCMAYVHGHQVGGTNPSLVEALGAGNAVIAHDNRFNRWVAGRGAQYFDGAESFSRTLDDLLKNPSTWAVMQQSSRTQFESQFTWSKILGEYEALLNLYVVQKGVVPALTLSK
jgi:glycosyltransferase involved in cell wall biosynthesis